MKKLYTLLFLSFVLAAAPFGIMAQKHGPSKLTNPLKTRLDSVVDKAAKAYMSDTGSVGLTIGVYRNGVNHVYSYGTTKKGSGQPIQADQLFNLGSVAKVFVGNMLAQAVVLKKANLNDDIRKYLPGKYPNLEYDGHPIRLVDMANHTSGLPHSARDFPGKVMDSLSKAGLPALLHFFSLRNQDSLLIDLHNFKVDTIPGTRYSYNGNAMMVLILLLERIYHQPYETLVTGYLKTHFKMNDTRTVMPAGQLYRFIQGYNGKGQPVQWFDLNDHSTTAINTTLFYAGGPSMNSTMADMLLFIKANAEEKDPAIRLAHHPTYTEADGSGIGLNWMFDLRNGGIRYYHSGHTGLGFNTLCTIYPQKNTGIMVVVNDNISQDKVTELEAAIAKNLSR